MKLISYTHNNKASFGHQATSDKIIDIASKFNYVDVLDFISNQTVITRTTIFPKKIAIRMESEQR